MTISTHHHFRNGDLVSNQIFDLALEMRDLTWFPSASFPCHEPLVKRLESGGIHHIEGSMNGKLGDFRSQRYQAVQDGEVHIDIAVIAAPSSDFFGNGNGVLGSSAAGCWGSSWPTRSTPTRSWS